MTTPLDKNLLLEPGDDAPEFSLDSHIGEPVKLSDFKGEKTVILAFYPKDNTPGCTRQMCQFSDYLERFERLDTVLLGVSCDSTDSHDAFARDHNLKVRLLSDTTRSVGRKYGAIRGDRANADRVLFVIDKDGTVQHVHKGMPDLDDLLERVRKLI